MRKLQRPSLVCKKCCYFNPHMCVSQVYVVDRGMLNCHEVSRESESYVWQT